MVALVKPLGNQVISIGSVRGGSPSGQVMSRSQLGPGGLGQRPIGAIMPADQSGFVSPPGSQNKPSGFTVNNAAPARTRQPSSGIILRRSQLQPPDTH